MAFIGPITVFPDVTVTTVTTGTFPISVYIPWNYSRIGEKMVYIGIRIRGFPARHNNVVNGKLQAVKYAIDQMANNLGITESDFQFSHDCGYYRLVDGKLIECDYTNWDW